MPNIKKFSVAVNVVLDRKSWRKLGYGDQPSKAEVTYFFATFLEDVKVEGTHSGVHVKYMGAPGHYFVTLDLTVDVPWWRRAGFGDTISRKEIVNVFESVTAHVASKFIVTVKGV